MSHKQAGME